MVRDRAETAGAAALISVVIPVLNGAEVLPKCLGGLARQSSAPPFEVIIVDNGSTDSTAEIADTHPVVTRVLTEYARGSYIARNAGIRAARTPIVAFTDADCIPDPGWLRAGLAAVEAGADLVGGRIEQLASPKPTVWERYDRATYLKQDEHVRTGRFAATANLFVRAEVFRTLGPFLGTSISSGGDVEFGRRATAAGYSLAYASDATVRHHPRTTFHATWMLHRRLGSGFAHLARRGLRPRFPWQEPYLRLPLWWIWEQIAADGPPLRRRQFAHVHALAMLARWVGWITRRA